MSNQFLVSSQRLINLHGQPMAYSVITEAEYDIETGSTSNTETTYNITMYKKHINATQYNHPDLIGKSSAMFYLINSNLGFIPAVNDKILVEGERFTVTSVIEHRARTELVLYRLIGIKG